MYLGIKIALCFGELPEIALSVVQRSGQDIMRVDACFVRVSVKTH